MDFNAVNEKVKLNCGFILRLVNSYVLCLLIVSVYLRFTVDGTLKCKCFCDFYGYCTWKVIIVA